MPNNAHIREKFSHVSEAVIPSKESSKILIKHIGAVHINTPLTITQRKLSNILLRNALSAIAIDKEHKVPMKELIEALDWSKIHKAPETLRESLRDLARIQIQWNILGKDNKNKWTTSALLAHVSIKDGYIYYSYSLALRELFANPNIYARLNLDVQRKFKNKHAVILWELICGDLSTKKEEKVSTDWLPYEKVLALTDLLTNNYLTRYTSFRDRVLDPAILEINENSDITVSYEEKRVNRKLTHMRFLGEKKTKSNMVLLDQDAPHIRQLKAIGLSDKKVAELVAAHSLEDINRALEFCTHFAKTNKDGVKNPVAFLKKALTEGWSKPQQGSLFASDKVAVMPSSEDMDDALAPLRQTIKETIGEAEYLSWIMNTTLFLENDTLTISCPSAFIKSTIEIQFQHRIQQALSMPITLLCGRGAHLQK